MSIPEAPRPAHVPVLVEECLAALGPIPGALFVDATLGLGGHAETFLERGARVLGIDRDPEVLALARARLARFEVSGALRVRHADHRHLLAILAEERTGPVDGILADLGVSSIQLDTPERGFSFSSDAPLDMRMDRTSSGPTAADLVARLDERDLARILRVHGEEPDAPRIARAIVRRRIERPIATTRDLADVVRGAKRRPRPGSRERLHPATLAFQALRIAVNDEVEGIERFVGDAVAALRQGGRLAVISFHSLEDRAVKQTLRALEKGCVCPPRQPICNCGREPQVRLLSRKPVLAGEAEVAENPRARSAKLRAAEKIATDVAPECLGSAA